MFPRYTGFIKSQPIDQRLILASENGDFYRRDRTLRTVWAREAPLGVICYMLYISTAKILTYVSVILPVTASGAVPQPQQQPLLSPSYNILSLRGHCAQYDMNRKSCQHIPGGFVMGQGVL